MSAALASYRLAPVARGQLLAIHGYSERYFGRYQADAYYAGFRHAFALLAEFPGIGSDVSELAPGLRRHRYQSHYIFYAEEADHVLIRAIIHTKQNVRPQLFR